MAQINDVINEINKTLTFLDWRDETHLTMKIEDVTKIYKKLLSIAQGEQPSSDTYDLSIFVADPLNETLTVTNAITGQVISAGEDVLTSGQYISINAQPVDGYRIRSLTINGVEQIETPTTSFELGMQVTGDITIETDVVRVRYNVNVDAEVGTSISIYLNDVLQDGETIRAYYGDVLTFVVDPQDAIVSINGTTYTAGEEYSITGTTNIVVVPNEQ